MYKLIIDNYLWTKKLRSSYIIHAKVRECIERNQRPWKNCGVDPTVITIIHEGKGNSPLTKTSFNSIFFFLVCSLFFFSFAPCSRTQTITSNALFLNNVQTNSRHLLVMNKEITFLLSIKIIIYHTCKRKRMYWKESKTEEGLADTRSPTHWSLGLSSTIVRKKKKE